MRGTPTVSARKIRTMRPRSVAFFRSAAIILALAVMLPLASCGMASLPRARGAQSTAPAHTVAVAIGDSITGGQGLAPDQAWPILVARTRGWAVTNLGTSGAGFSAEGTSGETYDDQIEAAIDLRPNLVLINGSDNDIGGHGLSLITVTSADMHTLRDALPHTVIVALSVIAPKSSAADIAKVDARVAATVRLVHGVYLDIGQPLQGREGMLQSDGEHPTAAGQVAIADAVDAALTAKHITG